MAAYNASEGMRCGVARVPPTLAVSRHRSDRQARRVPDGNQERLAANGR